MKELVRLSAILTLTQEEAALVERVRSTFAARFPSGLFQAGETLPLMRFIRMALLEYCRDQDRQ